MNLDKLARQICTDLGVSVDVGEFPESFAYRTILKALEAAQQIPQVYNDYWSCPQCGYQNENAIQLCNSCHTPCPKPE